MFEEHNNFGCPNTFMTDQNHKNLQFRSWADQHSFDISHRPDQPHYANNKTRIEYFNYMNDWHK